MAGSAFGPPGAVIGGLLGGLGGALSAKAKKKARKYTKKANALREQVYRLRSFAEQRNLLRQGQVQAAAALSSSVDAGADVGSSAFQGVSGSIYTQMLDNYLLGENIVNKQIKANAYEQKAGKAQDSAYTINSLMGTAAGLVGVLPKGGRPGGDLSPVDTSYLDAYRRPGGLQTYPVGGPGEVPTTPLSQSGN